ncbi:MAG: F0F1 ATP synthase subunit epsilon [Clostridiales bacterium]|nr:F0F1 ATP synthase subunit epsilon [Candidatus Crickella merdequi]
MAKSFNLEIITPSNRFYSGEVEHVICKTPVGFEGFMADHTYTVKLLEEGVIRFRESGSGENDWKVAKAQGGFIDVKGDVIVYTDAIEWN